MPSTAMDCGNAIFLYGIMNDEVYMHPGIKLNPSLLGGSEEKPTLKVGNLRVLLDIGTSAMAMPNTELFKALHSNDLLELQFFSKADLDTLILEQGVGDEKAPCLGTILFDDEDNVRSATQRQFNKSVWHDEQIFSAVEINSKADRQHEIVKYKDYQKKIAEFLDSVLKKQHELCLIAIHHSVESANISHKAKSKEISSFEKNLKKGIDNIKRLAEKNKIPKKNAAQLINLTAQLLNNPVSANCKQFSEEIEKICQLLDSKQKNQLLDDIKNLQENAVALADQSRGRHLMMQNLIREYNDFTDEIGRMHDMLHHSSPSASNPSVFSENAKINALISQLNSRIDNLKREAEQNQVSLEFCLHCINLTTQLLRAHTKDNFDEYSKQIHQLMSQYKIIDTTEIKKIVNNINDLLSALTPKTKALQKSHTAFFTLDKGSEEKESKEHEMTMLKRPLFAVLVDVDKTLLLTEGRADNSAYFNTALLRSLKNKRVVLFTGMDENSIIAETRSNPECSRLGLLEQFQFDGIDYCGAVTSLDYGFVKGNLAGQYNEKSAIDVGLKSYLTGRTRYRDELAKKTLKENALAESVRSITASADFHNLVFLSRESAAFEYWSDLEKSADGKKSHIEKFIENEHLNKADEKQIRDVYVELVKWNYFSINKDALANQMKSLHKKLTGSPTEMLALIKNEIDNLSRKIDEYQALIDKNDFDKPLGYKIVFQYLQKKYQDILSKLSEVKSEEAEAALEKCKNDLQKDIDDLKKPDGQLFYRIILDGSGLIMQKIPELSSEKKRSVADFLVNHIIESDKFIRKMVSGKENMARLAFDDEMLARVTKPNDKKYPTKYIFTALCDDNASVFEPVTRVQKQLKADEPFATIHIKADMTQEVLERAINQSYKAHMESRMKKILQVMEAIRKTHKNREFHVDDLNTHIKNMNKYANAGKLSVEFVAETLDLILQLFQNPNQQNCETFPEIMGDICSTLPSNTDPVIRDEIAKLILYAGQLAQVLNKALTPNSDKPTHLIAAEAATILLGHAHGHGYKHH